MSHDILICRIDEPIYAKVYEVSGRPLNGHEVKIYAECEKNIDSTGQNGAVDKVASENQQWEFEQKKRRSLASFRVPYQPLQVQSGR